MIKVSFVMGSALRKAFINGRKISLMSQETGFTPISMDLDNINEKQIKKKMGKQGLEFMKQISKLNTEEEMARDIINDFQQTGWRLIKKENGLN